MKVLILGGEKLLTFIYGFQIYIHLIQTSNCYHWRNNISKLVYNLIKVRSDRSGIAAAADLNEVSDCLLDQQPGKLFPVKVYTHWEKIAVQGMKLFYARFFSTFIWVDSIITIKNR